MRPILRTTLFLSAFSPSLLTLAYVKYAEHGLTGEFYQLLIVGVLGVLLSLAILKLTEAEGEIFPIEAKKIESNDSMLLAFVASYSLPLIMKGLDLSFNSIALATACIGGILWLTSSLPTHPILRLIKWRFYKIESSKGVVYTLITKRNLIRPSEIKFVRKISESMLLDCDY